jgi:DNA-3-methyladenine glycosylase
MFTAAWCQQDAVVVAPQLIGANLVCGDRSARIVEVEAYGGVVDQASHAFRGRTARNESMYLAGGHWYVYFTYGMHWCVNLVTGADGDPQAVLIRAAEPLSGSEQFRAHRPGVVDRDLLRGPARLTKAFGINRSLDATSALDGLLRLCPSDQPHAQRDIVHGPRIGIRASTELSRRWWDRSSAFVSGPVRANRV